MNLSSHVDIDRNVHFLQYEGLRSFASLISVTVNALPELNPLLASFLKGERDDYLGIELSVTKITKISFYFGARQRIT
jgi:hypothetical protein